MAGSYFSPFSFLNGIFQKIQVFLEVLDALVRRNVAAHIFDPFAPYRDLSVSVSTIFDREFPWISHPDSYCVNVIRKPCYCVRVLVLLTDYMQIDLLFQRAISWEIVRCFSPMHTSLHDPQHDWARSALSNVSLNTLHAPDLAMYLRFWGMSPYKVKCLSAL